jgi:hypothetical protein
LLNVNPSVEKIAGLHGIEIGAIDANGQPTAKAPPGQLLYATSVPKIVLVTPTEVGKVTLECFGKG